VVGADVSGCRDFPLVLLRNVVGDGLSVALKPHARQTSSGAMS